MTIRDLVLTSSMCLGVAGAAAAQEEQVRFSFADLDTNSDGFVSEMELQSAMDASSGDFDEGAAAAVIETQDADGDGMISEEEAGADDAIVRSVDS